MESSETLRPEPTFSFFRRPIKNLSPAAEWTLTNAWRYITGPEAVDTTQNLRAMTDKNERRAFKACHFDYVTFSGSFSKRGTKYLNHHSRLLCLDFDHVADVEGLFAQLVRDEHLVTRLLFRSPSGTGLKWVVGIDLERFGHEEWFERISAYCRQKYGIAPDAQCKDVGRACFLPYDPGAYLGGMPGRAGHNGEIAGQAGNDDKDGKSARV